MIPIKFYSQKLILLLIFNHQKFIKVLKSMSLIWICYHQFQLQIRAMQKSVQNTYKKVTQIEHVLLRPDTYVGSISEIEDYMWVFQNSKMIYKKIKYVPGLYKIFDEILVNAADNFHRDRRMSEISVKISDRGLITIYNDGKTIPVQIHKQYKIYASELIFGHLLTSSNYQDSEKKVTGGRNGYGAKLANIFSKKFIVETADPVRKKILRIEWNNNMSIMKAPQIIQKYEGKQYTKIEFLPDYDRFNLAGPTKDIMDLFTKRVYDLAGILKVKVSLNGKNIGIKNFAEYVKLYQEENQNFIIEENHSKQRWEVIIGPSDGHFQQISFVNSICTVKGGSHVNYIANQIINSLQQQIIRKNKNLQIKPFQIKSQLKIFINCQIQNPSFDSQTKQTLTTPVKQFGSSFQISQKMMKQIIKSGITQKCVAIVRAKQHIKIDKHLKKIKNTKLVISKLEDANLAGRADKCVLILTEGDSAKALAMSGLQQLGRDYFGIFPLKGKPMNVRNLSIKQVMQNDEISNIVKIVGLQFEKEYQNTKSLRYASIMIMADQDNDGSHIKGLILNLFQTFWPSLCKINGFLKEFITPIIRCSKNGQKISFYSEVDFKNWYKDDRNEWKIKYYKGLGTSTSSQAKQYFSNLSTHQKTFCFEDRNDYDTLKLIFEKTNSDARKKWLQQYDPGLSLDYRIKNVKIQEFINKQFVHFSIADNIRSIPSIVDGLKPSQRKIIFGCFKRNLKNQIKVAQLAGYVSEHASYHHGEASLCQTIVNMAQDYVGSNNFNLLLPIGQFGTRHMLGKDYASPRYIFTQLNPLTRLMFPQADDHIVEYLQDENRIIEPKYYYPILPLVLINGCEGIGTGWSTSIKPYLVKDVINLMYAKLKNQSITVNIGWQGYKGDIRQQSENSFTISGNFSYDEIHQTVHVTQIPISKSIQQYKMFLEEKLATIQNQNPQIQDIRQYHQSNRVHFQIHFIQNKMPDPSTLSTYLKLKQTIQQSNMHLFNSNGKIHKYQNVNQIMDEFYKVRLEAYRLRKAYLMSRFRRQLEIFDSKIRFIQSVISGKFKMNETKQNWILQLKEHGFLRYHELTQIKSTKIQDLKEQEDSSRDYNYLLIMPIWTFCKEKISQLKNLKKEMQLILDYYTKATELMLWEKDLKEFQSAWESFCEGKNNQGSICRKKNNHTKNLIGTTPFHKNQSINGLESLQKAREKGKKRLKQSQQKEPIQQQQLSANKMGRKRIKKDKQQHQKQQLSEKHQPKHHQQKIQQEEKSDIDILLSKYLKPDTKGGQGLSLEQRIRARLNTNNNEFIESYQKQKGKASESKKEKAQSEENWEHILEEF